MAPPVSKQVKPSCDVKNVGVIYANGANVCINCLLVEDNRPLIIIWAAFEHLGAVIVKKLRPCNGEAQSKLLMSVGLVLNTLMSLKCGQWICQRCTLFQGGLETDLEFLTKGIMLELGSVPVRVLEKEDKSMPPSFHDQFPHEDWLHSGFLHASDFANFSSSWLSLAHISTFLKALSGDSKKFLGMRSEKDEWRIRIGSLSNYWSISRTGCSEDLIINFSGLEKKHYRTGFTRLSKRGQDLKIIHDWMLKLSSSMLKGFSSTEERDGAKFLHHNLNHMARFGWPYEDAKPALSNLEKIISLETNVERVSRKRKIEGIPANNITGAILKDVKELNCFVRYNVQKFQHQQEGAEKSLRSLHQKYDLILALLRERSNGEVAAPAQVIPDNNKPSGVQGAAESGEVVAEAPNIPREPSSTSASEFDDVSEDEGPMNVDMLGQVVRDQAIEQAGFAALDALRADELNTPPLAQIDQHLHRQVDEEARLCEGFIGEQEGDSVTNAM